MSNTCHDCQRGPDDAHDSTYCPEVGHHVFHFTPACRAFVSRYEAQQQSACRGDSAPVRAVQSAYNVLLCGACRAPLRTPQVCWKCGRGQVWP